MFNNIIVTESPVQDPIVRRTPPPPYYKGSVGLEKRILMSPLTTATSTRGSKSNKTISEPSNTSDPASTLPTPRYNRRNNPDLEKRRIHHCDYPGNYTMLSLIHSMIIHKHHFKLYLHLSCFKVAQKFTQKVPT